MFESIQKFAIRTGLSESEIRRMCKAGELPSMTTGNGGGKRVILIDAALEIIERRAMGSMEGNENG